MDTEEFHRQIFPLKNKLFRFAKSFLSQTEEAEDVVQEVFLRLWKKREILDEYRSVEALAMTATKNMCFDKIRSKRYQFENGYDNSKFLENIPEETGPDHSDRIHAVHRAIRQLPEIQQMIVHLRDVEGCEFEEIASITEMNENAVRVALSRARKKIRELIINK